MPVTIPAVAAQPPQAPARTPRANTPAATDEFQSAAPASAATAQTEVQGQARLPRLLPLTQKQQRAYDDLTPDQRTRYDQLMLTARAQEHPRHAMDNVRLLLDKGGGFKHFYLIDQAVVGLGGKPPGREQAPAALERLLFTGRLTAEPPSRHNQNALEHLGVLASQKRTPMNVNSHALLADVILDLSYPGRIQQGLNNMDCGGTAAAIIMARDRPAEYARILTDLGMNGQVTIDDKTWLMTPLKETSEDGGPTRSLSQRLFAATYVDETNNKNIPPASDADISKVLSKQGEWGREMAKGLSELTGRTYKAAFVPSAKESSVETHRAAWSEAVDTIAQHLDQKAMVAINYNHHWVVATDLYTSKGGVPMIRLADGTGEAKRIPLSQLHKGIQGFVFDTAISTVPLDMMKGKNDKPGGGGNGSKDNNPIEC